jgi:hypothetical protein
MKLVHDFGVSALALTLVLGIMASGGILLVLNEDQEFALAWVGALAPLAKAFYDGYITYKQKQSNEG